MNEHSGGSTAVAPNVLADADDAARLRVWTVVQQGMIDERRKREKRHFRVIVGIIASGLVLLVAGAISGRGLPPGAVSSPGPLPAVWAMR